MSEQTPFAPFAPSPSTVPETPAAEKPAKKSRKPKGNNVSVADVTNFIAADPASAKSARRPRTATVKTHAPKFDLQTTLAAAKLLNEDDFPLFEKLIIMLDEAGKPTRERVMAALGKVFG